MDIGTHVEAVREDLAAVAVGDDLEAAAERLARALESSLPLRLIDVLSEAALELSENMHAGHVDVRISGRDVRLVLAIDSPAEEVSPSGDDATARLTLRMPEMLKSRVEEAADRQGVSTNSWLVSAVRQGLEQTRSGRRRVGSRVTGFARS
jgi:hypothetical protein